VDDYLLAFPEDENNRLEKPCLRVEAESKLTVGSLLFLKQFDPQG
jgi:hypothetical protein